MRILALFLLALPLIAQQSLDSIKNQAELDQTVALLDTQLFDSYNKCDLTKFSSFFEEGIEFYHDQGGLMVGKDKLTQRVKDNICGKTTRALVPGTMKVFPMKGYGAIETGLHRFEHPGHAEIPEGEGSFMHLWHYSDGKWRISRVFSYDHHEVKK